MAAARVDPNSIFLNVPFDERYERLFVTLAGTLVCLGQTPRCVLEVTEAGQGRLLRIFELIRRCRTSIHDLSRAGTPVRFNMPFELGLASALTLLRSGSYQVVVLDAQPYRLDRTLSDYKGRDALVHHNRAADLIGGLLGVFEAPAAPSATELRGAVRILSRSAEAIKRDLRIKTLFTPAAFRALIGAAVALAVERGYIEP